MAAIVMSRFSYPKVPGDSLWSIVDMTGPASYTRVLPEPPEVPPDEAAAREAGPTGGQMLTARDFGLQSVDWIGAMGSEDGNYGVSVLPGDFALGSALDWAVLLWIDATTGAEVASGTDLSDSTVRLLAIGR